MTYTREGHTLRLMTTKDNTIIVLDGKFIGYAVDDNIIEYLKFYYNSKNKHPVILKLANILKEENPEEFL